MRRAATFLLILAIAGCGQDPRVLALTLRLPQALGCRPTAIDEIELRALGDFPAREPNAIVLDPADRMASIERFADDTELVTIEARGSLESDVWSGGGIATAIDGELVVPVLRYGRGCAISSASIPAGAVVLALPDGRLWIAGGESASITTLRPGEEATQASALRLFAPRIGATASFIGDGLVLVAGGAASGGVEAYDSFEILDVEAQMPAFDGFLMRGRRDHAAIELADGRVLISGGRAGPAQAPLGDAEIVAIDDGEVFSIAGGALVHPRAEHTMFALDGGDIVVAGGVAANGEPVADVERFDGESFERIARFTPRREAAYAAIPGARLLQIGGREGARWTGDVEVLLEDGSVIALDPIDALEAPRAVALVDGRVVVAGRDPIDRRGRGLVLDPGVGVLPLDASRAPSHMVRLAGGTIVQGDADGISLLRVDLRTPLDPPPESLFFSIPEDRAALALDAPDRWVIDRGLVASVDGARFDLRTLALSDFTLDVDAEGAFTIVFTARDAELACATEFVAPVHASRMGDRVTIGACELELTGRVGIAVRAAQGTIVRSLVVTRD
jgi:hypothetical protein